MRKQLELFAFRQKVLQALDNAPDDACLSFAVIQDGGSTVGGVVNHISYNMNASDRLYMIGHQIEAVSRIAPNWPSIKQLMKAWRIIGSESAYATSTNNGIN